MKIQLTKTKSIEVALPFGGGEAGCAMSDVTGIDLDWDNPKGCPAVRLARRRGAWQVMAAGYVPAPAVKLPANWDEMKKSTCVWSIPSQFQASVAAVAAHSESVVARQTTLDGIRSEAVLPSSSPMKLKKAGAEPKSAGAPTGPAAVKTLEIAPGVPVSRGGQRFVVQPLADDGFVLQAGMPEFQVLWLSRLFPEGRRPTVASVQVPLLAKVASLATQSEFVAAGGTGMAVFVEAEAVYFAGWKEGRLALLRQCPGARGWRAVRTAVKDYLHLEEEMVDEVLDGSFVDPCVAMEPFLRPVFRELGLSADYLSHRLGFRAEWSYLMGLPSGGRYWNKLAEETAKITFIVPHAFDGLEISPRRRRFVPEMTPSASQEFLVALGAARAAMEGVR